MGLGAKKINIQYITPFGSAKKEAFPAKDEIEKIFVPVIGKYSKKIEIGIINMPFCYMQGYERFLINDMGKKERVMMFVSNETVQLYDYLNTRREKKECCAGCLYSIVCGGFWR
jgi:hypothetical protein